MNAPKEVSIEAPVLESPQSAVGRRQEAVAGVGSSFAQLNADMSAVIDKVCASLVKITNGHHGAGAGTIWHQAGLIITNAHVVGRGSINVTLPDGRTLPARILAQDRERDIAALTVEATGLPTIELGDSTSLKPGEWVFAVGHPWGISNAVTGGIVIGTGSEWHEMPGGGRDWVMVSLHLRPGHSGGPLVDVNGRLLGMNTMMTGPDVGVAVPVHVIKAFLRGALNLEGDAPKAIAPEPEVQESPDTIIV